MGVDTKDDIDGTSDPELENLTKGLDRKGLTHAIEQDRTGAFVVSEDADIDGALAALEQEGVAVRDLSSAAGVAVKGALGDVEDVEDED